MSAVRSKEKETKQQKSAGERNDVETLGQRQTFRESEKIAVQGLALSTVQPIGPVTVGHFSTECCSRAA